MRSILDAISRLLSKQKPATGQVSILCLLEEESDQRLIEQTCREHSWNVSFAREIDEARRLLERAGCQIVLLDRDLAGERWQKTMTRLVAPSGALCILLVSKVFDEYLWNEVTRNGGYDVLRKPLRAPDVARAIRLAWSYWLSAKAPASRIAKNVF